jgi:LysM repeat protein
MRKNILICFLLCFSINLFAQDTLWVSHTGKEKYIPHEVSDGETLYMLSQRFNVPLAKLSDINETGYQEGLKEGSIFKIPVDKYNYYRINSVVKSRPLFYRVASGESLRQVSRLFNVSQSSVQRWNKLDNQAVMPGQVLQVGWVYFDKEQMPFADAKKRAQEKLKAASQNNVLKDSSLSSFDTAHSPSSFERVFKIRHKESAVQSESGAAVFYPLKMHVKGGHYYAFHNDLPHGTIISVTNPASGAVIYAKVIGPLPKINEYHNAIVGLSNNAASILQAKGKRMFCKVEY